MGGQGGQVWADQLTLSQREGAGFCPTVLLTHPALGSFLRPCQLYTAFCGEVIYQ